MTVSSTTNRNDAVGNGATSIFPYTFRIFSNTDLQVTVRDTDDVETTLALTTDYTVDGVGDAAGGNVTLVDAGQAWLDVDGDLLTGFIITIRRVRPFTQETDIRNQGDFFPEVHEDTFDQLLMLLQQVQNDIQGALRLPETVDPATVDTTIPVPAADQAIRWNSAADALENFSPASVGSIALPAGNGIMVQNSPSNFLARSLASGAGISITDPDGVAGNPTIFIASGAISTTLLADAAVTADKLASGTVTIDAIGSGVTGVVAVETQDQATAATSPATLFSGTVAAGIMETDRSMEFHGIVNVVNNGGNGDQDVLFVVSYGGSTMTRPIQINVKSGETVDIDLFALVGNRDSTGSQYGIARITGGITLVGANDTRSDASGASMAIDSTVAQPFVVQAYWNPLTGGTITLKYGTLKINR